MKIIMLILTTLISIQSFAQTARLEKKFTKEAVELLSTAKAPVVLVLEFQEPRPSVEEKILQARKAKNTQLSLKLMDAECKNKIQSVMSDLIDSVAGIPGSEITGAQTGLICVLVVKLDAKSALTIAEHAVVSRIDVARQGSRE